MARAKRTERADARRRYRVTHVEQEAGAPADSAADESSEARPTSLSSSIRASSGRIRLPDFAGDARALVPIVRTKPVLLVPYGLLLVGAIAALVTPTNGNVVIGYVISFTLIQPTLLFFAVGFLAPRAAYLFGGILGLLAGIFYVIVVAAHVAVLGDTTAAGSITGASVAFYVATDVVSGAIFGWFAAWYRDFLRRTQTRSREAADKRKREQQRQARRNDSKAAASKPAARRPAR